MIGSIWISAAANYEIAATIPTSALYRRSPVEYGVKSSNLVPGLRF